jgi:radical SAM protein with 4Fe4S-binding SPASM domain
MQVISEEIARRLKLTVSGFDPPDETAAIFTVRVTVENSSDLVVDSDVDTGAPLNLSYHWLDADTGEVRVWEGGRTQLLPGLAPHCRAEYELKVTTPIEPGRYLFQPAMVQEGILWLDALASVSPVATVVNVERKAWWAAGDSSVLFSPHEVLNRKSYQRYLAHRGAFRPIALFCETVNLCNNSCIICPYDRQTRAKGTMSMDLFDKVLRDYSALGGGHLSFTPVVGDALLDRHLVERIRRCEAYPSIQGLSFTTNGAVADLFDDEELEYVLSRLRRIYISVYGLNEGEYRTMTRRDTYKRLILGIERILRLARNEVVLGFRLLVRRSKEELNEWLENLDSYRDCKATVSIHPPVYSYSNWGVFDISVALPGDARWREAPGEKDQCLIPLLGCQVFWDGNVSFCPCDDYDEAESLHLGNLHNQSLAELYNSRRARDLWNWRQAGMPEFCRKCSFYQPLTNVRMAGDIFEDPLILAGG